MEEKLDKIYLFVFKDIVHFSVRENNRIVNKDTL